MRSTEFEEAVAGFGHALGTLGKLRVRSDDVGGGLQKPGDLALQFRRGYADTVDRVAGRDIAGAVGQRLRRLGGSPLDREQTENPLADQVADGRPLAFVGCLREPVELVAEITESVQVEDGAVGGCGSVEGNLPPYRARSREFLLGVPGTRNPDAMISGSPTGAPGARRPRASEGNATSRI
jgi:hypothetical protein